MTQEADEERRAKYARARFPGVPNHKPDCRCPTCDTDRLRRIDVVAAMISEAQHQAAPKPPEVFWCHANTIVEHTIVEHAFPILAGDLDDPDPTTVAKESMCGVSFPDLLFEPNANARCADCEAVLAHAAV